MQTATVALWIPLLILTVHSQQHPTASATTTVTDKVTAAPTEVELEQLWPHWKRIHKKQYANQTEEAQCRQQWMAQAIKVMHYNLKYDLGLVSYSKSLNQLADLSWQEVRNHRSGVVVSEQVAEFMSLDKMLWKPFNRSEVTIVPAAVDWRDHGLVRSVKNQGNCQSCWAFSATGVIEGQYTKRYGKELEFSVQQLVDCSRPFGNFGCNGGSVLATFEYLKQFGLEQANVYPYRAVEQQCRFNQTLAIVKVKSFSTVHNGNEQDLKALVASRGPVWVQMNEQGFHDYTPGIYNKPCSSTNLTHSVLVVGYGTEHGTPYWIIKNSWGQNWGEAGYMRLARNRGNMCGVASIACVLDIQ